ncbi:MAG TPA: TolC family protein [Thermodesulfovibrionales bacterium]|nr:TolC family protein [Thermodesulfovibrionales bacterium]
MKEVISFVLLLACLAPVQGWADEMIQKGEVLTIERCIEIALKRQPNIVASMNTVNVNESRIGEAKSNYYPQISGTAGYARTLPIGQFVNTTSSSSQFTGFQGGAIDQYTASFTLSQNIYDFGRTSSQVKISKLNFDSSRSDLENVTEQTVFAVKQNYYGVVQAKHNRTVLEDTVKQTEQHLEQARGFYEVGTKPKFDVIKAEVDVSTAKLNLIKAENDLRIAVVNLNNAMGVPEAPEYTLSENISFEKYGMTLEEALSRAYENRPDLQSIVAKRRAAEVSIDLAKTGYYPFLTGNASYTWSGQQIYTIGNGWTFGAAITVPIFSGFLTKSQVEEAKANADVLRANEESVRQTVFLDVQQAYLTLRAAEEAIPTAKLGVDQAQENLDIANGRYAAGVGSPVEVTDAEVSLANSRLSYIQALYADKVAQASLEKAMGMR